MNGGDDDDVEFAQERRARAMGGDDDDDVAGVVCGTMWFRVSCAVRDRLTKMRRRTFARAQYGPFHEEGLV